LSKYLSSPKSAASEKKSANLEEEVKIVKRFKDQELQNNYNEVVKQQSAEEKNEDVVVRDEILNMLAQRRYIDEMLIIEENTFIEAKEPRRTKWDFD